MAKLYVHTLNTWVSPSLAGPAGAKFGAHFTTILVPPHLSVAAHSVATDAMRRAMCSPLSWNMRG